MAQIIAQKGKETRKFTELQWKLLGKDKNGWVALNDQPISNSEPIVKPPTGEKAKSAAPVTVPIDNAVGKTEEELLEGKTENKVDLKTDDKKSSKVDGPSLDDKKAAFMDAAKNLRPGNIKDYFDGKKQSYKKNAQAKELIKQLGEYLKYDVEELNKAFN